jgi:hypothetical protein
VPQYESVVEMIAISNDSARTDAVRSRTNEALIDIGLALSQNKEILKAATEGTEELNKILPSSLHEIQPYILSVILTDGKDDFEGQEAVSDLVDLFKLKKKSDVIHGEAEVNYKKAKDALLDKLYEKHEEVIDEGEGGRIETMMGYILGMDEKKHNEPQEQQKNDFGEVVKEISEATKKILEVSKNVDGKKQHKDSINIEDVDGYETLSLIKKETDPVKLTAIARKSLDYIEGLDDLSNRYRLTGQPTDILDHITNKLDNNLMENTEREIMENKDPTKSEGLKNKLESYRLLSDEIQARLTIFDISKLVENVSFRITELGRGGIGDMIDTASKMNRVLDRRVMGFCFKESEKVDLNIPEAWNMIQRANFEYPKFLKEIYDSGFIKDMDWEKFSKLDYGTSLVPRQPMGLFLDREFKPWRAELVDKYIVDKLNKLSKENGKSGTSGKKSYKLANELVNATAERPAFNFAFIKADNFSECIYFKSFRDDDAKKGKKVGPYASRGIESLAHGWLRYFSNLGGDYLSNKMGMILAEDVKIENIKGKKDSFMYFGKILPGYVLATKNALMDSSPDMKKVLDSVYLQELVGNMDKVDLQTNMIKTKDGWKKIYVKENSSGEKVTYLDGKEYPIEEKETFGRNDEEVGEVWVTINGEKIKAEKGRCGEQSMRVYYALGLLELLATKENLGWDINNMKNLRRILVETKLSETAKPFLTEEQWKWCLKQKIANNGEGKDLTFSQAMNIRSKIKFTDDFWDSFINGSVGFGKKRK